MLSCSVVEEAEAFIGTFLIFFLNMYIIVLNQPPMNNVHR